jgi:predicted thioesterase
MKNIPVGISYSFNEEVTPDKGANAVGSGLLEVYSTPAMIALMEKTSYLCVDKYLDPNESTVGGAVNIRHLKPTAIGKRVVCNSKVVLVSKSKIDFEVEVMEDGVLIGKGTHARFVIYKKDFLKLI